MSTERRGNLGSSRKPYIDPKVAYELSKLQRAIPSITWGTQVPGQASVGDFHFYSGDDTADFKSNNWYVYTPTKVWHSMNATNLNASNITGAIPSGVTINDYLSLFGGVMQGLITFASTQTFPADKIAPGNIPAGVKIADYVPKTGGQFTGALDFTDKNMTSLATLFGIDADTYIAMGTSGQLTLAAAVITLIGSIAITGALTLTGALVSSNITSGAQLDQDARAGAAPNFLATNFSDYNIVCTDDDVVTSNGEVVYSI